MASALKLTWRGAEVERKLNRAIEGAMNETMEAARDTAKDYAPVLTGALKDDIRILQPATLRGSRWVGKWGNTIYYAIFQEAGTIHIVAKYYLRSAVDVEYPHYKERLRRWMSR